MTSEPKLIERPTSGDCRCGRPASKPHCPVCGRMDIYCRSEQSNIVSNPDGGLLRLRVYRCKICGLVFNDHDWMLKCMAPFKKKTKREMIESFVRTSVDDRQKVVNEKYGGDIHEYTRALARLVDKGMHPDQAVERLKSRDDEKIVDSVLDKGIVSPAQESEQPSEQMSDEEAKRQLHELMQELDGKDQGASNE